MEMFKKGKEQKVPHVDYELDVSETEKHFIFHLASFTSYCLLATHNHM